MFDLWSKIQLDNLFVGRACLNTPLRKRVLSKWWQTDNASLNWFQPFLLHINANRVKTSTAVSSELHIASWVNCVNLDP